MNFIIEMPQNLTAPAGSYLPSRETIEDAIEAAKVVLTLINYPTESEDEMTIHVSNAIQYHTDGSTRLASSSCGDVMELFLSSEPWTVSGVFESLIMALELREYLELRGIK